MGSNKFNKCLLFLYAEIMPYTMAVFNALHNKFGYEIHVVHWDTKKTTPYQANKNTINKYRRSQLDTDDIISVINDIEPELIAVSGRMDKAYLQVCKRVQDIPTIMMSDNQWKGTLHNYIASLFGCFLYKRYFKYAWVSGVKQYEFARRIGFSSNAIIKDCYSCNVSEFINCDPSLKNDNILFIGRLEKRKGIDILVECLLKLKNENKFNGKLIVYGKGHLRNKLSTYDWIELNGFKEQKELIQGINKCSFFCLPSRDEPWGVVIHEMAAAGMPILCSNVCGAADEFVINGFNGYTFEPDNTDALSASLEKMLSEDYKQMNNYSSRSKILAKNITPYKSAAQLLSLLN